MAANTESEKDDLGDSIDLFKEVRQKFGITVLTDNQKQALTAVLEKKDVFVSTKTGSGKSLSYEAIPVLVKKSSVLVIAPLLSIMVEQTDKLNGLGLKATYIGKSPEEDCRIQEAYFDYVFASPENVVGNPKWREVVSSVQFLQRLKLIVVDEAHTVLQWGTSKLEEDPFRRWFNRIGELRSLCLGVPIMALTATASPINRKLIMRSLCFKPMRAVILDTSDRLNIKMSTKTIKSSADIAETFDWLMSQLAQQKEDFPRHLIFCSSINDTQRIYTAFLSRFGRDCLLYNMYHSKTYESVKQGIRKDMQEPAGKIRVLICTNAAGMGVNFKGINNIVHYGLPREMDSFVQQMGRAGRDDSFSEELVLLKLNKNHLKRCEPDLVELARSTECRHKSLCSSYLCDHVQIEPLHNCCDICEKQCQCENEICPRTHPVFSHVVELEDEEEELLSRQVSKEEKDVLRQQLGVLKLRLESDIMDTLVNIAPLYGLSGAVIDGVVEHCSVLFTATDIMTHVACWSYAVALEIAIVVNLVFGDNELYNVAEADISDISDDD